MPYKELIASLESEADEKIRSIWEEAKDKAGNLKSKAGEKMMELARKQADLQAEAAGEMSGALLREASEKAREIKLSEENMLAQRLYKIALSSLPFLRKDNYGVVFRALSGELPPFKWQEVRVNPEDSGLAAEFFPAAEIIADSAIVGGLEASALSGGVKVINTFEKRLEKAWPEIILPGLLEEIHEKTGNWIS